VRRRRGRRCLGPVAQGILGGVLGNGENDRAARQAQKIPSEKFVKCRPTKGERVPAPEPGEVVIFFEHFRRGFALPASNFLW
jgi:hypothetical protein